MKAVRLSDGSIIGRVEYTSEQIGRIVNGGLEVTGDAIDFLHTEVNGLAGSLEYHTRFLDFEAYSYFFISKEPKDLLGYLMRSQEGYFPEVDSEDSVNEK